MFICNTAIDLKIDRDNNVKILEFEAAHHAGSTGYESLTGKDMLDDIVYPWMEQKFNVPVLRPTHEEFYSEAFLQKIFNMGSAGKLPALEAVIASPRFYYIQPWMLQHNYFNRGGLVSPIISANAGFLQLTANKTYLDYLVCQADCLKQENAETDGQPHNESNSVASLFPDMTVFDRDLTQHYYEGFADDFVSKHKQFVIKLPNESQHHGLVLANQENIGAIIHEICQAGLPGKKAVSLPGEWRENNAPLFSVQEKVQSKPVEKNGKAYDGTMRVFATIWYEPALVEGGKRMKFVPHIHIHDAYWKLPPSPIGLGDDFNQCVSFCPSSIDDENPDKMTLCEQHFALVSDEDKALVESSFDLRMNYFLTQVFLDSVAQDPARYLLFMDAQNNEVCQNLGAMLLLNNIYYHGSYLEATSEKPFDPANTPLVPDPIVKKLMQVYDERPETSFLRRYMNDIAAGKDYHFVLTDSELKQKMNAHIQNGPKI